MDEDRYLSLTGRLKEIINRGGEKISPREVDEVIMDHPAVRQVVTFAMPHDKLGEEVRRRWSCTRAGCDRVEPPPSTLSQSESSRSRGRLAAGGAARSFRRKRKNAGEFEIGRKAQALLFRHVVGRARAFLAADALPDRRTPRLFLPAIWEKKEKPHAFHTGFGEKRTIIPYVCNKILRNKAYA